MGNGTLMKKRQSSLQIVNLQASFTERGFTAPLDMEAVSNVLTPCQYDYSPQNSHLLRDIAPGHDHRPIIIAVTPRAKLLQELLALNYLTGSAKAEAEDLPRSI